MHRFFAPPGNIRGGEIALEGADCAHMARVLRLRAGDTVTVCDGEGMDYVCRIAALAPDAAALSVLSSHPCAAEPPVRVTLYQAVPKGDKLDGVVKRAVELGVSRVVPVITARCVAVPDGQRAAKRRERLQSIAREAAKQCGRGRLPEIGPFMTFQQALIDMDGCPLRLMPYEDERARTLCSEIVGRSACNTAFIIGPEGGFERSEHDQARAVGLAPVSLGPRILRTETASAYVLSALSYEWERAAAGGDTDTDKSVC